MRVTTGFLFFSLINVTIRHFTASRYSCGCLSGFWFRVTVTVVRVGVWNSSWILTLCRISTLHSYNKICRNRTSNYNDWPAISRSPDEPSSTFITPKMTPFHYFETPWDMDFINECSTRKEVKWKLKSVLVLQKSICLFGKERAPLHNFVLIQVMYINQMFNF